MRRFVIILATITIMVSVARMVLYPDAVGKPIDAIAIFKDTYSLNLPFTDMVDYLRDQYLRIINLKNLSFNVNTDENLGIVERFTLFIARWYLTRDIILDFLKFPVNLVQYSFTYLYELARWFVTLMGQIYNPYG